MNIHERSFYMYYQEISAQSHKDGMNLNTYRFENNEKSDIDIVSNVLQNTNFKDMYL